MTFTIIIPTFKRPELLARCLESVQAQTLAAHEVFVVDDCAPTREAETVCWQFPGVRYFRQEQNRGPGPARNLGLRHATGDWVVPLDDDDELTPDALEFIARCAAELPSWDSRPFSVIQFAVQGERMAEPRQVMTIDDYLHGGMPGECKPVLHRGRFLAAGYEYPEIRIGGENLLWWAVAQQHGIPTFQRSIMRYNDDATERLTSFGNQVRRAAEYAELQERTLALHGDLLREKAPEMLRKKQLGAATYWLLAGRPDRAAPHLATLRMGQSLAYRTALKTLPWIPAPVLRRAFLLYRDVTVGRQASSSNKAA